MIHYIILIIAFFPYNYIIFI